MKHWLTDVLACGGLLFIGWGCWLLSPSIAGIVVGSILLATGLAAHFKGRARK